MKIRPHFLNCSIRPFAGISVTMAIALFSPKVFAADQFFSNAGGPLNWDTVTSNWGSVSGGPYTAAWGSGNAAIFVGTAGIVNVGTGGNPTVGNMTFNVSGYTLQGGQITLGTNSIITQSTNTYATVINSVIGETGGPRNLTLSNSTGTNGLITLGGANTYTGTTTLTAARVSFNNLQNGGTASSFGSGTGSVTIVSNASFTNTAYTGAAVANTDRLFVLGGSGAATIRNDGSGAISFNNTGSAVSGTAGSRSLTLSGSYTAAANTFAQTMSDMTGFTSSLSVSGNTWNITGANTHSGGTSLGTSGVLNIGHATALGNGTFTVSGNGSFDNKTGSNLTISNALTLSGGSPTYVGSANDMAINGAVTLSGANRTITVTDRTLTLGGAIGQDVAGRSLTKAGSGTLTLVGSTGSTYSGGTTISAGTLAITAANNLGTGTAINFGNSDTPVLSLAPAATGTVQIPATTTVNTFAGKIGKFGNSSGVTTTFDIAAKITGSGHINRASGAIATTGAVRFSNDTNDYTGSFGTGFGLTEFTSVANAGLASSLGAGTGAYNIGNSSSSATLRYVGNSNTTTTRAINWSATTGALSLESSGTGTVGFLSSTALVTADGNKTLTMGGTNEGDNTFAQSIHNGPTSGTTSLQKSGGGKWILTGTHNYSGATAVTGGTLEVNGSAANSAFTVSGTGKLSGTGTIGALTVSTGGTVNPGNSPGMLNTGDFALTGGTYLAELASAVSYDQLNVTGSVSLNGVLSLSLGYTPALDALFFLMLNDGTDAVTGNFTGLAEGATVTSGATNFKITYLANSTTMSFAGGNDVALMVIPEPSAAWFAVLGLGVLSRRRRI